MGFFGSAEGEVHVKKEKISAAMSNTSYNTRGNPSSPQVIEAFLNFYGFSGILDEQGNIERIKLKDEYINPELAWELLNALAQVADEGAYIHFEGEKRKRWDWKLENGKVIGGPFPEDDEYCMLSEVKTFKEFKYSVLADGTAALYGYKKNETKSQSASMFAFFAEMDNFITVPDSFEGLPVTLICANAFLWNREIKDVLLPATVKRIGDGAFCGCWSFLGVSIPQNCTYIGKRAFSACKAMEEVTIPGNIRRIGSNAFEECDVLETVKISPGINSIPDSMFLSCHSLVNVKIPASVVCIEQRAFADCTALKDFILPNHLRRIEAYAFAGCNSMETINIPESVTYIGDHAFSGLQGGLLVPNEKLFVKVAAGSYAEQYCKNNQINFLYAT